MWIALARQAVAGGFAVELPWGDADERARAERIAAASGAAPWDRRSLDGALQSLAGCGLAIGVDSGLAHLSAALGVPTVSLYGSTDAVLTGCRGAAVRNLQAEFACAPCLSRTCRYRGALPDWQGQGVAPPCYHSLTPERVWQAALALLEEADRADRLLPV
jgi:heptosyltransferase-1